MEAVTVSSKGQIAIPKGGEIVLSREPAWKKLRGLGADPGIMEQFAEHRRAERELEDAGIV